MKWNVGKYTVLKVYVKKDIESNSNISVTNIMQLASSWDAAWLQSQSSPQRKGLGDRR